MFICSRWFSLFHQSVSWRPFPPFPFRSREGLGAASMPTGLGTGEAFLPAMDKLSNLLSCSLGWKTWNAGNRAKPLCKKLAAVRTLALPSVHGHMDLQGVTRTGDVMMPHSDLDVLPLAGRQALVLLSDKPWWTVDQVEARLLWNYFYSACWHWHDWGCIQSLPKLLGKYRPGKN